ncbi:MAG: chromate efflux transporter [Gammaproteobacteria bacterium]
MKSDVVHTQREAHSPPTVVPLGAALAYWLKLGFISFGGPAGQIGLMHQEVVERQRWVSEKRFLHALNYTMVLPGPEAQQLATYLGWLMHGTWGGLAAGTLFVLPSLALLIALSWVYLAFGDLPVVTGVLYGIKPAVTAIVLFAAYRIGSRALKRWPLWLVAAAAFVAIFALDVPFPAIVVGAALIGIAGAQIAPGVFQLGTNGHAATGTPVLKALIDDDTPTPEHARYSTSRTVMLLVFGVGLWGGALGLLAGLGGWTGTGTQMGVFFSKAAMVTFGGAYAVLPYVFQGGVETYAWLSAPQMIDGLALGETTPGPLIMVVAFVGYLGGWNHAMLGADALAWSGTAGAVIATFFTFLPSFLFILVGGPLVEATRHDLKLAAPLSAITAAVVGVIVNLALFFAYHVLWPQGLNALFEWPAALIGAAAFIALFRYRRGVVEVIAIAGATGMAMQLLTGSV